MSGSPPNPNPQDKKTPPEIGLAQRFMIACGALLVLSGAVSLIYGLFQISNVGERVEQASKLAEQLNSAPWAFVLANGEVVLFFITGVVAIFMGNNLMRRAISATAQTITDKDRRMLEPLIAKGDDKAIGQYVRLASLSGMTGVFTKLGFTGLPLATAALGVLLLLLAMTQPSGANGAQDELLDLAKLVIGAFIGSFVQRKVAQDGGNEPEARL